MGMKDGWTVVAVPRNWGSGLILGVCLNELTGFSTLWFASIARTCWLREEGLALAREYGAAGASRSGTFRCEAVIRTAGPCRKREEQGLRGAIMTTEMGRRRRVRLSYEGLHGWFNQRGAGDWNLWKSRQRGRGVVLFLNLNYNNFTKRKHQGCLLLFPPLQRK